MAHMEEPFFNIPPLFSILCILLGSALLVSPYLWLYGIIDSGRYSVSLGYAVLRNVLRILFLSLCFTLFYSYTQLNSISGNVIEIAALVCFAAAFFMRAKGKEKMTLALMWPKLEKEAVEQLFLLIYIVFFWTLAAGSIYTVNSFYALLGAAMAIQMMVGLAGGVGLVVLFILQRKAAAALPEEDKRRCAYHDIIWPVALGLLMLIVPLLMYQFAYDPEFYEKLHPPPTLSRA